MNESQRRAFSALGIGPLWCARSVSACARPDATAQRTPSAGASSPLDAERLSVLPDESGRWLFIGEDLARPGLDDAAAPRADSMHLLDRMLAALGLRAADEALAFDPRALAARTAVREPCVVVALGEGAARLLLGTDAPLASLRGSVHEASVGARALPLVVSWHPARLLEAPQEKAGAWADLCLARAACEAALSACSVR
ncbi:MAG TPA: hypothetical protein VGE10_04040 [Zeimonas sp.]